MRFDALCLACLHDELTQALIPGRIQQVLLPGARAVGLEVYAHQQRHQLLLQADPDDPRVQLIGGKLRRGVEQETPLLLLLRKYARDALLTSLRQPDRSERVLELGLEHREHGATTLVVELVGRATNLILRRGAPHEEGGLILECLLRVPPGERVRRVLLPGRPYAYPPAVEKLPPLDDGSPDYYERLAAVTAADGLLWRALVAQVAGVSPAQAREIALRTAGDIDAPAQSAALPAVVRALQELWLPTRSGEWQPGLWRAQGRAVGFSPYAAQSAEEFVATPTLSLALEAWAIEREQERERSIVPALEHAALDPYAAARRAVAELIARARSRLDRQLEALARDEPAPGASDALRTQAEWLLAFATRIEPGATALHVPADETGSEPLSIPLETERTPVEQAERWFDRAARMDRAAAYIPQRRAHLQNDRAWLADLEGDLALAQSRPEIAAVEQAIYEAGLLPSPQRKAARAPKTGGPRRFQTAEGFTILAGRNAVQNDRLTFEIAEARDLWLHVRGAPGSHVVVQTRGRPLPESVVIQAAQVAGCYSSLQGENAVDVVVTERRHVSRVPGGRPGQVLLRQERTLRVPARLPEGLYEE